jgi:hypothetical protein
VDHQAKLIIFQSQTKNVQAVRTSMRQVHRSINAALRNNNEAAITAFTKIYALLFYAWAESNFSKVINTPYGFDPTEIEQVQGAKNQGIREAWKKGVTLGLRHLDARRGNFLPNAQQKLERAIDAHVYEPSLLRNKLAHGQWIVALNRANDAVNVELSTNIATLNLIVIDGWIKAHELLALAVETLIESPKKTFMRDWYKFVDDLENQMIAAESRTLSEHVARLKAKDLATNGAAKRRSA